MKIVVLLLAAACAAQGALPELFPIQPPTTDLEKQTAALSASTVPAGLKPAVQFQKTFLKILATKVSKAKPQEPDWVNELRSFIAADQETDPVAHGVAEVARAWMARAQMQKIDVSLHIYYRQNVRFPDQFSIIEPSLPEALRHDPWGDAWNYQPCAPDGFTKLAGQRYKIGPSRFPDLGTLGDATSSRHFTPPAWKIAARTIGSKQALEFRLDGSIATVEAGGMVGPTARLLYIGDGWALLAGTDQLFALTF